MGRIAAHTQEQVFEVADKLAAEGKEVTPTSLREVLGRGSFSTLGKHIDAWQEARKTAPVPVVIDMPESVKAAFAQCWQAAAAEAGKEIAAIREKADAEIKGTKRRLDEALAEVERLEEDANTDAAALESAQASLAQTAKDAQQAATDAAAREAALSATADQMAKQIEAQQAELSHVHAEADAARKQHAAEVARLTGDYSRQLAEAASALQAAQADADRLRGQLAEAAEKLETVSVRERTKIEEAATAKAEAARLADQLKEQKARSVEVIGKLEKSKQGLEADLTASRKEARTASGDLARAQGELEALRTQVARLNDTIRGLAAPGEKKGKGGAS